MGNCDVDVVEVQSDFNEIPGVGEVSVYRQERSQNRMGAIESDVANLEDTFV